MRHHSAFSLLPSVTAGLVNVPNSVDNSAAIRSSNSFPETWFCKEKMHRGWAFYECNLNLSLVAFDSLHPGTLPLLLSCFVWQL